MKRCRGIIGGLLALSLTFGGFVTPFTTAEAATKATIKEAKAAYSKYLKDSGQAKKFRVLNVLGDNIPEILTCEDYGMCVYTYNTKDKLVESVAYAYGNCELYYNPEKNMLYLRKWINHPSMMKDFLKKHLSIVIVKSGNKRMS